MKVVECRATHAPSDARAAATTCGTSEYTYLSDARARVRVSSRASHAHIPRTLLSAAVPKRSPSSMACTSLAARINRDTWLGRQGLGLGLGWASLSRWLSRLLSVVDDSRLARSQAPPHRGVVDDAAAVEALARTPTPTLALALTLRLGLGLGLGLGRAHEVAVPVERDPVLLGAVEDAAAQPGRRRP